MFPRRGWLVFGHDLVAAALSFILALYLRVGDTIYFYFSLPDLIIATAVFTVIAAGVFLLTGLYKGIWRYASIPDLMAIARAATLTIVAFLVVLFVWTRLEPMPRSVPLINWFVLMALLGGPRFLYRIRKDRRLERRQAAEAGHRIPVLVVGSGSEAELFIRGIKGDAKCVYDVVGIVAEKQKRVGQRLHGVPVLGVVDDLPRVVEAVKASGMPPERLVLAKDKPDGALVRRLLDSATALGLTMARAPRVTDFRAGHPDRVEVRPIAVEDLLCRPQTPLDRDAMRALITGRRVAVTGAGGSIGSELVRQLAGFKPAEMLLIEQSEFNLYTTEGELRSRHPGLRTAPVIADVRNRDRLQRLFLDLRPELVFHAAALKHVPLVEANPFEGIATNVFGSINVADAAVAAGAGTMVMVSTDKAINPTSIMGASKRIAERYCQALDMRRDGGQGTRFVTVRFGNVLGSTGSVVPLFQRQLANGGPITVTHPDMRRYFMTVREAVELILEASVLAQDGVASAGKIFVLDMGEPVRIVELARQMIRLAGLTPDVDVNIRFIGLRPGEKLFEELFNPGEDAVPTDNPGLRLAAPQPADLGTFLPYLEQLAAACDAADAEGLVAVIRRLVPEYQDGAGAGASPLAASA
ncbi:MAG: polysaccharide biosynthesis protein [Rhodospirillales bacterium]|nr:MAG: polysaccharide biosynthesis protein [Rhodospirillales bacterium]